MIEERVREHRALRARADGDEVATNHPRPVARPEVPKGGRRPQRFRPSPSKRGQDVTRPGLMESEPAGGQTLVRAFGGESAPGNTHQVLERARGLGELDGVARVYVTDAVVQERHADHLAVAV